MAQDCQSSRSEQPIHPLPMLCSPPAHTAETQCCHVSLAVRSRVPEAGWHLLPQGKQGKSHLLGVSIPPWHVLLSPPCTSHPVSPGPQCLSFSYRRPQHREACVAAKLQAGLVATRKVHGGSSFPPNASGARLPQWWWWVHLFSPCCIGELLLCSSPVWLPFLPTRSLTCCCRIQNRRIDSVIQLQPWLCCPCHAAPCGDTHQPKVWLWAAARDCNKLGSITHIAMALTSTLAPLPWDVSPSCEGPRPPLARLRGSGCRRGAPTMRRCSSQLAPLTPHACALLSTDFAKALLSM